MNGTMKSVSDRGCNAPLRLLRAQAGGRADQYRAQRGDRARDGGEGGAPTSLSRRLYCRLGMVVAGSDDWWITPALDARTRAIFARGHYFEARVREQLVAAGFKFAPPEAGAFRTVNGDLRGHADGVVIAGPNPLGSAYVNYPFL